MKRGMAFVRITVSSPRHNVHTSFMSGGMLPGDLKGVSCAAREWWNTGQLMMVMEGDRRPWVVGFKMEESWSMDWVRGSTTLLTCLTALVSWIDFEKAGEDGPNYAEAENLVHPRAH